MVWIISTLVILSMVVGFLLSVLPMPEPPPPTPARPTRAIVLTLPSSPADTPALSTTAPITNGP